MGEVVSINKPKPGDENFVMCTCQPEGKSVPMAVVAIFDKNGIATITQLVCPDCEQSVSVEYGQVTIDD